MSQIAYSSVPVWARPGDLVETSTPTPTGGSYLLVGVGDVADALSRWEADLAPLATTRIHGDAYTAADLLADALAEATVGVRVWIVADAGSALRLRAVAVNAGLEDDEIEFRTTGSVERTEADVFCSHCRTVTRARVAIDDVIPCAGCRRDLLVYHHVSRRTGQYLGFMVDAETQFLTTEEIEL
ncbi:dimethylamine monooxygenase subunit DmmA family protein [Gordonia amicalis]|uniref:dimethylamine monooxygenase subunit DmmA family protein n=1 Tax=Gordonia amicalis TaxID=89053 RepID=UPI0022B3B4A2|nr:dimethylamine monooxygenase subunit DmmA family protein [Gordonia amicalis]MCZ4578286.1 dimethylamine monooxygenase subunit DmmA family protein [Gordonia amicalis]